MIKEAKIAKNINVILKSWGLNTSQNNEKVCKMQYKCTTYSGKPEKNVVVHAIKDCNIDWCWELHGLFYKRWIDQSHWVDISLIVFFILRLSSMCLFYLSKDELINFIEFEIFFIEFIYF